MHYNIVSVLYVIDKKQNINKPIFKKKGEIKMARIIKTGIKVDIGTRIRNIYTDNTNSEVDLYKGDMVTNLQYVANEEVISVTGKIIEIGVSTIPGASKSYIDISDFISNRIMVNYITIDHSELYDSNISKIPAREILEYKPEDNEMARVDIIPIIKVTLEVTLSDYSKSTVTLTEGTVLSDVVLLSKGGEKTVDIDIDHFVYSITPKNMNITVSGISVSASSDYSLVDSTIPILLIKSCGKNTITLDSEVSLQSKIDELKESGNNDAIVLLSDKYKEKINITNESIIRGYYSQVPANTGIRCSGIINDNESIIADKITCGENSDVVIQGVTITEDSLINLDNAKSVTFKNCKFIALNPLSNKSFIISGKDAAETMDKTRIMIEGCYFGNNNTDGSKSVYNGLEFGFKLAKGSYIKNCYFAKNCVTHNIINIYSVEDEATIYISGNHFEYSANAIRIGTVGNAKARIVISDNTYDETDPDTKYAGLLIVQPYGKKTISMHDLRIDINNTTKTDGQLYYLYYNENDTEMNEEICPKLYVDGVRQYFKIEDKSDLNGTFTE